MASLFGLLPCPHVDSTGSAEDACERILEASRQGQGYDMLVLDSASRGMCLSDMRSALAEAGIAMPRQIVVVTASNAPALRADPMLSGIAEVIHKPLLPADLRRLCGELVPASEARQAAAVETHEALAGARFLLVEDNEINQQVASELLQSWGAAIDIAENGARGLECLLARESGYYAAVLMDLNMPVMDGIEATRRIRAEKRFAGLPVLALTAHAVGPELQQALKEGMNGHIAKPFEPAELLQRLRTYVVQKETGSGKPVAPGPSPALDEAGFVAKLSAIDEIDAEPLLRRFKGRMASLTRALKLFCKDAPGILAKLEASLADTDLEAARREAHTLKGLAGTFGMTALASAALDLELALKEGKAPEVQLLAVLGESLNAVIEKLAELFPELSFPQSPLQPVGLPPLSEQS